MLRHQRGENHGVASSFTAKVTGRSRDCLTFLYFFLSLLNHNNDLSLNQPQSELDIGSWYVLQSPPSKESWKRMCKSTIISWWEQRLRG